MRLFEITDGESYPELRDQLTQSGTVAIKNAGFSSEGPSLGTLENLGAGRINRQKPGHMGKWFGFSYFRNFPDGTPIQANIDLGHGKIMQPGDSFMDPV